MLHLKNAPMRMVYIPIGMYHALLYVAHYQEHMSLRNSEGVLPVSFLKALLKAVFEL